MTLTRVLALTTVLLITGCTTAPAPAPESPGMETGETVPGNPSSEPADPAVTGTPEASPSTPTRPSPDEATLALLNQSDRAAASGAIDQALAYVERAVRIDPRRADLWTRLAQLELANEDPDTAIRYARKALSLAGSRVDWSRDAWLVIADAKEALGESAEATEIRSRWTTVRG
jgi:predicted Zn-dependent protease